MRKLISLFVFLAAACAPGGPFGSSSQSDLQNFSIEIPAGWRKVNSSKYFMLTREGVYSQYILVHQRPFDRPFKHTESRLKKDMLPKEAAGVLLDEMSSDSHLVNFLPIEYLPADIGKYVGFRIVFGYQDKNGQKFRTVFYGLLEGDWFYSLRYCAKEKKYSDKDMEALKQVVNSFKIVEEKST